jgi:hypothetical protein
MDEQPGTLKHDTKPMMTSKSIGGEREREREKRKKERR